MGLFDKFKKKPTPTEDTSDTIRKTFTAIVENDPRATDEIKKCTNLVRRYFYEHKDKFENRGELDPGRTSANTLKWIGCVDIAIDSGYAVELDYKTELADFLYSLNELRSFKEKSVSISKDDFDESEDISVWCKVLGQRIKVRDLAIGHIDIDSDSYVLFLSDEKTIENLSGLSKLVGKTIANAQDIQ